MDRLKRLKTERTQLRRAFTKISNEIEGFLCNESRPSDELPIIKGNLNKLQDKADRLFKLDEDIKEELYSDNSTKEEDFEAEFESVESYRDIYSAIKAKYDHYIDLFEGSLQSKNRSVNGESNNNQIGLPLKKGFNLPKLQINQFDGNVKNWIAFWGQFKKIHEDSEIENEDKFQYLIQSLKLGSPARELVDSFPPSAENYLKAVEQLKSRFGRDEFLIEVYVRELLSLVLQQAMHSASTSLCKLYDKLVTQLRALETLGVTSDRYASMLYPLVESALPEDTLRAWERHRSASKLSIATTSNEGFELADNKSSNYLQVLLNFLKIEVESDERLTLARTGFKTTSIEDIEGKGNTIQRKTKNTGGLHEPRQRLPTAATILTTEASKGTVSNCIFCTKSGHSTQDCSAFQKLTLNARNQHVTKKGCCFACLKPGHTVKNCKVFVKCLFCSKKHYGIMCKDLDAMKPHDSAKPDADSPHEKKPEVLSNFESGFKETLLQTLIVKVTDDNGKPYLVRVLLDTGSQRSYITKDCIIKLGLCEIGKETVNHSLFGGVSIKSTLHKNYLVTLQNVNNSFKITVPFLDQEKICNFVPRLKSDKCFSILKEKNIVLTDVGEDLLEVKILLGADVLGNLFTGAVQKIDENLFAMETYLGWTIMGKQLSNKTKNSSFLTLFCTGKSEITDLWSLETIGIKDPVETKRQDFIDAEVVQHFKKNIKVNNESRYEVSLPWLEGHPQLLDNYDLVKGRLMSTTRRLRTINKFDDYDNVFKEWLSEGIIERVPETAESTSVHYLPHQAVLKESSLTTKIRPVFDASAKDKRGHSLNECLAGGPNLVKLIPSLVMKFREKQIGVTADIRKAFLQISVSSRDRDFLRFIWWENYSKGEIITFRHCRVVFGISSSPFLLGATIDHHLENAPLHLQETAKVLKEAFYIDNCITSVDSEADLSQFVNESMELMGLGQFELREWASNYSGSNHIFKETLLEENVTSLLGMLWDRKEDELFCDIRSISMPHKKVTKRDLLSVAQRIFDVVGFTCPVSLLPKLLLQEVWMKKVTWDEALPDEISNRFSKWVENIHWLERCRIPRRLNPVGRLSSESTSLHVFCDASQLAYAACVFVRTEQANEKIVVQLINAKSRIAPKNTTIPRLELLAALIGTRIYKLVQEALKLTCQVYFYSDSTIVLTWIKEKEDWGTFVGNRCKEICETTNKQDWYHLSGDLNPADLPSRGCGAKTLHETRWWEGPDWLKNDKTQWPVSNLKQPDSNAYTEKRKTVVSAVTTEKSVDFLKSLLYFSSYLKLLRVVAWIFRFYQNSSCSLQSKNGQLTYDEIKRAEEKVIQYVQTETFEGKTNQNKNLPVFVDDNKILRVKTRLFLNDDSEEFKFPILLPSSHPIVTMIIMEEHVLHKHAGIQAMLILIRERFWVLKGRKTIRNVLSKCVKCRRFKAKAGETPLAPLPVERIRVCNAFQTTGIDMAGPLYLRSGEKAWIVVFTCAVYRAVHLELVQSLNTESFISALRRFISRRGRISIIYTDNGTNFTGTSNLLKQLDWTSITKNFEIFRVTWKFNPPSSPWWGGWWERIVRMVKELLRRNLGLRSVNYEELNTLICDFESIINSRPLTYVSDESDSLQPLTPALFLQSIVSSEVHDLDMIDTNALNKRVKYIQNVRENLRSRFKKEYLAMLVHKSKIKHLQGNNIKTGDVVLIGDDNTKRIKWPLALVLETIPGKDGVCRVAKLKTAKGECVRPIKRLYPLEVSSEEISKENLKETKDLADVNSKTKSTSRKHKYDVVHPKEKKLETRTRVINTPKRYEQ